MINFLKRLWELLFPPTIPMQPQPVVQPPIIPPVSPQPVIAPINSAHLIRTYKSNETLGLLSATRKDGQTLNLKVLELPWLNNEQDVSCIPGNGAIYQVEIHAFYDTEMYQIMNVLNRTGIFQHPANYTSQLLGCQAMGEQFADINGDGLTDVTNSVDAVNKLKAFFNTEPYTLTIS